MFATEDEVYKQVGVIAEPNRTRKVICVPEDEYNALKAQVASLKAHLSTPHPEAPETWAALLAQVAALTERERLITDNYTRLVTDLNMQVAGLTADRNSEQRWAADYSAQVETLTHANVALTAERNELLSAIDMMIKSGGDMDISEFGGMVDDALVTAGKE